MEAPAGDGQEQSSPHQVILDWLHPLPRPPALPQSVGDHGPLLLSAQGDNTTCCPHIPQDLALPTPSPTILCQTLKLST